LQEFIEVEGNGCSVGPNTFDIEKTTAGKTIAVFGLPGAFTPTCSAKHVPGYMEQADALKAAGVDEIWCISVNDPFVMGAWGQDQSVGDSVVMLADGNGELAAALGLEMDGSGFGLGPRIQRFAAIIDDGVVSWLAVEPGPGLTVSSAEEVLAAL
jgi:glutaredoxin/glutathione-dependent peroxiredoxin